MAWLLFPFTCMALDREPCDNYWYVWDKIEVESDTEESNTEEFEKSVSETPASL